MQLQGGGFFNGHLYETPGPYRLMITGDDNGLRVRITLCESSTPIACRAVVCLAKAGRPLSFTGVSPRGIRSASRRRSRLYETLAFL